MIEGVSISPLKEFSDDRGSVMHMLRNDSAVFQKFGEIYFSKVHFQRIKAWHCHQRAAINYAVPVGGIRLVLFDDRPDSSTRGEVSELDLGEENYRLVTVPPMIWYGFVGTSTETALVANCSTEPHDPNEAKRLDVDSEQIPYTWPELSK